MELETIHGQTGSKSVIDKDRYPAPHVLRRG